MAKILTGVSADTKKESIFKLSTSKMVWILLLGAPFLLLTIAGVFTVWHFSKTLPSLDQLEQIEPRLITRIYDRNNDVVQEYFVEKRIWTDIDSIPKIVPQALMATEDRAFYDHWGMNLYAIPSAIIKSALTGAKLRGASTLSQQLAKNLFLTPERSLVRKIKEAMTAVAIEYTYTKEEILELYMNQVYMGAGCYGFQSASVEYFGKRLNEIGPAQAALLAGMLQRPEGLRPDRHPEAAKTRRDVILKVMLDEEFINAEEYQLALTEPVYTPDQTQHGEAGAYFSEEVRKYMEKKYGESSLYKDGLDVYTTLDLGYQKIVEEAVSKQLDSLSTNLKYRHGRVLGLANKFKMPMDSVVVHWDSIYALFDSLYLKPDKEREGRRHFPDSILYKHLQAAAILIENETGAVLAMVGGENFEQSKFNRAIQSVRQPGSSFKPFVYALAVDNGAAPTDSVNDQPIIIPDPEDPNKFWRPGNYENKFDGFMTYRTALYKSKNLPAIKVGMDYGLNNLVNYARKFGLKNRLEAVPSLAIGSIGATLMEMTSAYTVFPNGGTRIEPYMVDLIKNRSGEVLEKNFKVAKEVLSKQTAYILVDMLKDVNVRGTAARIWARGFHHPSGGKTGTTNDYTDAWYVGFTPKYTMGVWIGQDNHQPMGRGHTGGEAAMPIWFMTMMKLYEGKLGTESFEVPPGVVQRTVCRGTSLLAPEGCSETEVGIFNSRFVPTEYCKCDVTSFDVEKKQGSLFSNQVQEEKKGPGRARKSF